MSVEDEGHCGLSVAPSDRKFSMVLGAITGLILAAGFASRLPWLAQLPAPLALLLLLSALGALVGGFLGGTRVLIRRRGIFFGFIFGFVATDQVVGHYLEHVSRYSADLATFRVGVSGLGTLLGGVMGSSRFLFNKAPVWVGALTGSGLLYIVVRGWMEDYPTLLGISAFGVGALVGGFIGSKKSVAGFMPALAGGLVGTLIGFFFLAPVMFELRTEPFTILIAIAVLAVFSAVSNHVTAFWWIDMASSSRVHD